MVRRSRCRPNMIKYKVAGMNGSSIGRNQVAPYHQTMAEVLVAFETDERSAPRPPHRVVVMGSRRCRRGCCARCVLELGSDIGGSGCAKGCLADHRLTTENL